MVPAPKKALRIGGRALRTVSRLPARVSGGRGSGRNTFSPLPGELPIVVLRLQVVGCKNLLAKDKSGYSDPFVVVSVLSTRLQTPVLKRNTNPLYPAKDATFDFPIYLSLADKLGVVELVVWDKDMLKKEYLGEVALPLDDWFRQDGVYAFDHPNNQPFSANLVSTRASTNVKGTVQIKLGFVEPAQTHSLLDFSEVYTELVRRSRPSLVSAPPTEGIGTLRSHLHGPEFEDDGGISSDEGDTNSDEEEEEHNLPPLSQIFIPPPQTETLAPITITQPEPRRAGVSPTTPTANTGLKTPVVIHPAKPGSPGLTNITKILRRPTPSRSPSYETPPVPSPSSVQSTPTTPSHQRSHSGGTGTGKTNKFRRSWSSQKKADYNFSTENDIHGIVMLEIHGATDLPRLKNMTRTGWDMDPFVVISFGKKVFRTRIIRHSLNPIWDEKLLFHVREYESAFKVQLTVLDWDKLSSNDHVGDASFMVSELLADAPQRDGGSGLYDDEVDGKHPMKEFRLGLSTAKEMPWEAKHNPVITFRAKYQPYDALRQQFWRQYLKQYDTDDTGTMSHIELTSMLDSLGSTLSAETISSFFTRNGKKPQEDELTFSETIQCLETEVGRPTNEKKRIFYPDDNNNLLDYNSTPPTPNVARSLASQEAPPQLGGLDFSGPPMHVHDAESSPVEDSGQRLAPPPAYPTEFGQQLLSEAAVGAGVVKTVPPSYPGVIARESSAGSSDAEDSSGSGSGSGSGTEETLERVINVKNCPLCHRPRLNKKAEMDIITHLAVCASGDWAKIDRIVVGNFVTASQAQRKWYTKVISKVSSGDYRLGANSANIIVQNRMTGQLEEEKMQVYVRLGIRLLYKGAKSRMEGARARRLLKSLSIKQGIKYDDPESIRDIVPFIQFHRINVDEILEPINSFKTFNEFFYRKLKPSARPVELPDDPYRLVSSADCRFMAFESVNDATRLWIKGREFTVARLLGDAYKGQAERYCGGAVAIFRLAPQDYHRFHSPVDGTIGPMTYIPGEYYTVNPQAIRTPLDVYGENARKIVPIDSPAFGRVMAVCVGAMMVGSIETTVEEGGQVKRGQEFGYFAFGGSTIVLLFEKGVVEWDEDLLINGRASLETLVRVGMGIGRGRRVSPHVAP